MIDKNIQDGKVRKEKMLNTMYKSEVNASRETSFYRPVFLLNVSCSYF